MEIYLRTGQLFTVPTAVADHLLKLATHDQLKILLYVLCHANDTLTEEQITKACKVPASAIAEALSFWQEVNVLRCDAQLPMVNLAVTSENKPSSISVPAVQEKAPEPIDQQKPVEKTRTTSSAVSITPSEIADYINGNPEAARVFDQVSNRSGRIINHFTQRSLYWMHEYLGLPADVILLLAVYCMEIDAFTPKYIDEMAIDWAEKGITNIEAAQKDIQRRKDSRSYSTKVMRILFGPETRLDPTKQQQKFITQWQIWEMPLELIEYACEQSRDYKGNKSLLSYIHKVLTRWHESGITTVAQAELDDAAFRESRKQGKAPAEKNADPAKHSSIDMDEAERLMNAL